MTLIKSADLIIGTLDDAAQEESEQRKKDCEVLIYEAPQGDWDSYLFIWISRSVLCRTDQFRMPVRLRAAVSANPARPADCGMMTVTARAVPRDTNVPSMSSLMDSHLFTTCSNGLQHSSLKKTELEPD